MSRGCRAARSLYRTLWGWFARTPQPLSAQRESEGIMSEPSFTAAFTVDQTPQQAFDAITNPRGWWSEEIEGTTDKAGEEFT